MPPGAMNVTRKTQQECPLSGFSCGAIVITYAFQGGKQGPEHPNPGQSYSGTSRTCYLPQNEDGEKLLKLLQISWNRKLTFRVSSFAFQAWL